MPEYYLRQDIAALKDGPAENAHALLQWAEQLSAEATAEDIFRNKEGRVTLRFVRSGRSFFLKLHRGVGWREIIKNLMQGRLPVLGARNEYRAVLALVAAGVDTMSVAAYASEGGNPAARLSMIVTDDLVGTVSLEDYCAGWSAQPPEFRTRLQLLLKLADSAGRMHRAGINHRDFYICHFHLDEATLVDSSPRCHLIDLHRAQIRSKTPRRWKAKDLAGLYFSAMDCGLSRRDVLRFIKAYDGLGLAISFSQNRAFWEEVERKARHLYRKQWGKEPPVLR